MGNTGKISAVTSAQAISIHDKGTLELIQTLLEQGLSVRVRVTGKSMLPFLRGGETVNLSPVAKSTLRLGDLLFHTGLKGYPVIHRLVRRRFIGKVLYLQTKGDSCANFDPFVPADQILARVQSIETTDSKTNEKVIINMDTITMSLKVFWVANLGLAKHYLRRISGKIAHLHQ